jgi:hypothetical protein
MESPMSTLDSPLSTPHTLKKKTSPPTYNLPTQNLKGKNPRHFENMYFPLIG